ncbi:MAG TPA: hypothetical protein VFA18_10625 [Gemmataceae bacterium]|nr:hypothetical protein [Gemmataceae bacterium]
MMAKLTSDDKKKVVKVILLASSNLQGQPEFLTVDRDLANLLIRRLQQSYKDNKENVVLLPAPKVEQYKDTHPNWALDVPGIGKYFKADYVVWLQVDSLSLYEQGSNNMLYQGHANIQVSLYDMSQPDAVPQEKSYVTEYPRGSERPVDSPNSLPFQQAFLDHIAKDLCRYFDEYDGMDSIDLPSPLGYE